MAFIVIQPARGMREKLVNTVNVRVASNGVQFTLSRDVAERVGLLPGGRARIALGTAQHAGQVAITPAANGEKDTYCVTANGNQASASVTVCLGAKHFGLDRSASLKTVPIHFGVSPGSLIATLPAALCRAPAAIAA
jgi:hypothetical protein